MMEGREVHVVSVERFKEFEIDGIKRNDGKSQLKLNESFVSAVPA